MSKKETTDTTAAEEVDATTTEEETEEETTEEVEETEEESEDEGTAKKDTENEAELDTEIEKERKGGQADPNKAKDAFKKRESKRTEEDEDESSEDEDKPLTRKDLADIEARAYKRAQAERAREIADTMATSPKQAELMIEVFKNRTFPPHLSLKDQMEEVYAIVNRKKLIGERNEALRGLKGKDGVNRNAAQPHQKGKLGSPAKIAPNDLSAITAAGYKLNTTSQVYEKKLGGGQTLVYDPKSKKNYIRK